MTHLDRTYHVPKFGGDIWYINKGAGADTNSGKRPDQALETIGAGITAMSDGDALSIKAGTYTETGLDLSNDYAEMWCEIGVLIDPASGTALTVSGNSCAITGMHKITPAGGATGLAVTGTECHIEHGKIVAGAIGVLATGAGLMMENYACGFQTTTAYDIQCTQGRLKDCNTKGNAATIGFKINGNVDTGILKDCTSVGHQTAGFSIATGSADWTLLGCSSGHGDGRWVDVDHANVWVDFHYDDVRHKTTTFADAPTEYNIFKVTGGVRISELWGIVETVIPNTASTIYLELYSSGGTATPDITDAPGVNIQLAAAGSVLVRLGSSADALVLADPTGTPATAENTSFKDSKSSIDCIADNDGADITYVRLVLSAALASGAIDWHCTWQPLTDDGFLEDA
jgi:hypothetical protein